MFALRTLVRYVNIVAGGVPGVKRRKLGCRPTDRSEITSNRSSRGLTVLQAFNAERPAMTLADMARATGLTRATARRLLLTLVALGYVCTDGRTFELTPRVLDLGFAYVSSLQLPDIAQPFMEALSSSNARECVGVGARWRRDRLRGAGEHERIMGISLAIGPRLPAAWTSMGRVLLAGLNDQQLDEFLDQPRHHRAHVTIDHRSRSACAPRCCRCGAKAMH